MDKSWLLVQRVKLTRVGATGDLRGIWAAFSHHNKQARMGSNDVLIPLTASSVPAPILQGGEWGVCVPGPSPSQLRRVLTGSGKTVPQVTTQSQGACNATELQLPVVDWAVTVPAVLQGQHH